MDMFAGVAEHMPQENSVDDIIRNYSPHLAPNTLSSPPTAELRKILGIAAQEMLIVFLRKSRTRRRVARGMRARSTGHPVDVAVDTVLVKLYAQFEKTKELLNLLQEPNDVSLSEVEPVLQATRQYNALCLLYKQLGEDLKLLESWAKLIDGQWSDDNIKDPKKQMIVLLSEKRDKALTQRWAIWLIKRDPESVLKVNLDVLDVISLVPSDWPLKMMSSFLARSFRRTLHIQLEDNIIKNLSAGQNLEYDWTWDDLRDSGSIIEEDVSDNEDTEEEKALGPQSFDEKRAI